MPIAKVMLYCPNPACQTPNPEDHQFCQKCQTLLPHRYLWALGGVSCQPGELLVDRYLCKRERIFLDTHPGLLSSNFAEVPERFLPYLRLAPLQPHVPQVYDWISSASAAPLILLEQAPLYTTGPASGSKTTADPAASNRSGEVHLFPALMDAWPQASPLRQLNWLWQLANLWHPLSSEQVAASLFEPDLLRVEGALVRLLELRFDADRRDPPTLVDLGQLWSGWIATANPKIRGFLQHLCQGLIDKQIRNAELLTHYLDAALAQVGQTQTRQIQIATLTDQGPTRQRNEDACYPASGTVQRFESAEPVLLIVCDGIGGHQGGDVASHLAIESLEQHVKALPLPHLDPTTLTVELEKAIAVANDQISQRNDQEQRYDRQRMGTTLVMGLARGHELYIMHVGDSRAYWITRRGCHQITLDDDVASREVRLGYSFYRQALQQPSAGSLVQALGMGGSSSLYPTVQRLIPDEDCLFLLCSDGLSDNDRVEEVWESELLPILDGSVDLATASRRLVDIGNQRNGYDNVTVGLIHYRIPAQQPPPPTLSELPPLQLPSTLQPTLTLGAAASPAATDTAQTRLATTPADPIKPRVVRPQPTKAGILPLLLGIGVLLGMGGLLLALLLPSSIDRRATSPIPQLEPEIGASPPTINTPAPLAEALAVGNVVQLTQSPLDGNPQPLQLLPAPAGAAPEDAPPPTIESLGVIPQGTLLGILKRQEDSQRQLWLNVRVCSTPAGDGPEARPTPAEADTTAPALPINPQRPALVQPGDNGWIAEATLLPRVTVRRDLSVEQISECLQSAPLPTIEGPVPSPTPPP